MYSEQSTTYIETIIFDFLLKNENMLIIIYIVDCCAVIDVIVNLLYHAHCYRNVCCMYIICSQFSLVYVEMRQRFCFAEVVVFNELNALFFSSPFDFFEAHL